MFSLSVLGLANRVRRDEVAVVLIDDVSDALALEAVDVEAALEPALDDLLDDVVYGVVHALDHAGQHEARFHHVLIRIDADHEVSGAAVLHAGLLDRIERAESPIARGG